MKKLLLILITLNIALFGYILYDQQQNAAQTQITRLHPINPERVQPLSAQQFARLGPSKLAQLTLACAEWGPFSDPERQRALALIEPLALGRTVSTRRVEAVADHWVFIAPKETRGQAERAVAELRRLGVTDIALISDGGEWDRAISLGVFRSRESAENRLTELRNRGVRTALYQQRPQTVWLSALVIREPSQNTLAQLEKLALELRGSSVSTGACPNT